MTDFGEKIKKSLRIKHSSLDDEIESNIEICLLLLRGVGITEEKALGKDLGLCLTSGEYIFTAEK